MHVAAIEKFEEADRTDHSLFLRLAHDQLAIYREQRNDAAIDELHCTVVGKFRRIFGHGNWNTVTAMHEYGQMLCGEKRYEQAEALALGAVYAKCQKMKQAEAILVRAMVGFQRQSGERDARTLTAAFNIGDVYQDRGKLSHTIRTYHGAAHGFREIMEISYKTTITAFTQLAALCSARRAFPEAEEAYTLALQGLGEAARQDSIDALIPKLDLGILYRDVKRLEFAEKLIEGRAEEAEVSFADAAKEFVVCDEEYSAMSYTASFGLGNLLRSQRRLAEAEAMYRQAWNGARSVGGPRHATFRNKASTRRRNRSTSRASRQASFVSIGGRVLF
ncbi:hypothetical protein ARSEF4850_003533 [Beauveria asiatica]